MASAYDELTSRRRLAIHLRRIGALGYTLFPGRLFGTDGYNPYTDSIYVYSDIPCLGQEQAAYAKLIRAHAHPGTYVALTSLPLVRLWPMKQAKDDVLDYSLAQGTLDEQHEAIHVLYSEFGAEVGGQLAIFAPAEIPLTLAAQALATSPLTSTPHPSNHQRPRSLDFPRSNRRESSPHPSPNSPP